MKIYKELIKPNIKKQIPLQNIQITKANNSAKAINSLKVDWLNKTFIKEMHHGNQPENEEEK